MSKNNNNESIVRYLLDGYKGDEYRNKELIEGEEINGVNIAQIEKEYQNLKDYSQTKIKRGIKEGQNFFNSRYIRYYDVHINLIEKVKNKRYAKTNYGIEKEKERDKKLVEESTISITNLVNWEIEDSIKELKEKIENELIEQIEEEYKNKEFKCTTCGDNVKGIKMMGYVGIDNEGLCKSCQDKESYWEDDDDDDWMEDYACSNGCCACCGCTCNDWYEDEEYYRKSIIEYNIKIKELGE